MIPSVPAGDSREPLRIDSHTVLYEPPTTCLVTYVGDIEVEHVRRINTALEEVTRRHGRILLIADLSRTGRVVENARGEAARGMTALNPTATAVFGASRHLGLLVSMLVKAARVLKMGLDGPVRFFATEAEARVWISQSLH